MPFHTNDTEPIEKDSSSFSISSLAHEHKILLGTTTAAIAIFGSCWYYYKYHYVEFGGKPLFTWGDDKDDDNSDEN